MPGSQKKTDMPGPNSWPAPCLSPKESIFRWRMRFLQADNVGIEIAKKKEKTSTVLGVSETATIKGNNFQLGCNIH
jgi:hypothetical protein